MAFNSCSLNFSPIGGTASGRRAVLIAELITELRTSSPPPPPSSPPPPTVGFGGSRPGVSWARSQEPEDQDPIKPTELEGISVTIQFDGVKSQAYQEVKPDNTLVFASNLKNDAGDLGVNIENIAIKRDLTGANIDNLTVLDSSEIDVHIQNLVIDFNKSNGT
jgi:hypothetical protein